MAGKVWVYQIELAVGNWGRCSPGELRQVSRETLERCTAGPCPTMREATKAEIRAWIGSEGEADAKRRTQVEKAMADPAEVEEATAAPEEAPPRRRRAKAED